MAKLRNGSKGGFEPGLSRLRVRHSTAELPRSTAHDVSQLPPGIRRALTNLRRTVVVM